ncbi:CDP-alcohol phosphatidyltransferase family protein [Chloroflexota bacterium]
MKKVESIAQLRRICEKEEPFLERPVSFIAVCLTKLFLYTGISANQVTLLSIFIGLGAGIFFVYGQNWSMLVGSLMWCLHGVLDYSDGQIARYRCTAGLTGTYLDKLAHQIVDPYIFITIAFGLYSTFHSAVVFAFGFSAGISMLLYRLATYNTYICIVEERLHYLEDNTSSVEEPKADTLSPKEITPHGALASRLPFIYALACYMPGYGMIIMLLVATVIDLLTGPWAVGPFTFNSVYIYLCLWGILTLFPWTAFAWLAVKNRSTERLYAKLFGQPMGQKE